MNSIKSARSLAITFANQLNTTPNEAQNWSALESSDDLPEFDYRALRDEFGQVTREMGHAYKSAFNATFIPIGK